MKVDDGVQYIICLTSVVPSSTNPLQNYHILRGIKGTASSGILIELDTLNLENEMLIGKNLTGQIVQWANVPQGVTKL